MTIAPAKPSCARVAPALMRVRDLHAFYGKSHIIQGLDLDVGPGEIVSVLGRNGVGRSTMLKAIMGDVDVQGSMEQMFDLFPGLRARAEAPAGVLSGGEQQMLTICRTLMGNPRLIMIDEPTEGLAPMMVELVGTLIQKISKSGTAVLLVEQKLAIALQISRRLYVMGHGKIVFEGSPQDLEANRTVRQEWLEV